MGKFRERSKALVTLEMLVAILLAFSALGTAWATWMSQLHGSNQAQNYAAASSLNSRGSAMMNSASIELTTALSIWNNLVALDAQRKHYLESGDAAAADLAQQQIDYIIRVSCDDELALIVRNALAQDPVPNVFDDDAVNAYYAEAQQMIDEAAATRAQGDRDNLHSDAFAFVCVLYSVVLFLMGAVGIIKNNLAKRVIVAAGLVTFVIASLYMFSLPLPTDFTFWDYLGKAVWG